MSQLSLMFIRFLVEVATGVLAALIDLAEETSRILNCSHNLAISASFTCSKSSSRSIFPQHNRQNLLAFSFSAFTAAFRVATSFANLLLFAQAIHNLSIVSVAACSSPRRLSIAISCLLEVWRRCSSSDMLHSALHSM